MAHHPGLDTGKTCEGQRAFLGAAIRLDPFAQSPALSTFLIKSINDLPSSRLQAALDLFNLRCFQ